MPEITIPYCPRPYQLRLHKKLEAHRFSVVVMHRRAGKTVMVLNQCIKKALLTTRANCLYAYIAPYREQAKAVAWSYLKHFTDCVPERKVNESELSVRFPNTATIRIFGADNADALRGLRFDGVIMDEVADMKPHVWQEVVRPALSDRQGWAIFIGTPKGANQFQALYEGAKKREAEGGDWCAAMLRVDETGALPEEEVKNLQNEMSANAFRQEYLCDFAASSDDVLIPIDIVTAATRRSLRESDVEGMPLVMGVDVARFGDDSSVICLRRGLIAQPPVVFHGLDNMELADRINGLAHEHRPDAIFIDAGQGSGVIDRLRHLGVDVVEVPFGGRARNYARYVNRRSEMWYELREWIKSGGMIPDNVQLKAELSTPQYSFNSGGQIVLEPKDKIKERLGGSPDIADALALTFAAPVFRAMDMAAETTSYSTDYNPTDW